MNKTLLALLGVCSCVLPVWAESEVYRYPDLRYRLSDPNPASAFLDGSGRLQFPSLRLDVGTSFDVLRLQKEVAAVGLIWGQAVNGTTTPAQDQQIQTGLSASLQQLQRQNRLDYEWDLNLFSFSGAPFAAWQLGGKPLSWGVSLGAETRGFFDLSLSEELRKDFGVVLSALPSTLAVARDVRSGAQSISGIAQEVNTLNNEVVTLSAEANTFLNNPSQENLNALNQRLKGIDDRIDNVIPKVQTTSQTADAITTGMKGILDALSGVSEEGLQITTANDLHLTLGVNGAYPIYETQDIQVSLGGRVKLFMLPYNVPLSNIGVNSPLGLLGKVEIKQIADFSQELTAFGPQLTQLSDVNSGIRQVVTRAEALSSTVDKVTDALDNNNVLGALAQGPQLLQEGNAFSQAYSQTQGQAQQVVTELDRLQRNLLQKPDRVYMKGLLTTPDAFGAGLDFGLDAIFYRNLRVGVQLQNPLVWWPGTERPFEMKISNQVNVSTDESKAQRVNYTATVPFAFLLTSQYRLDDLTPQFSGLTLHSIFDYVANGRSPGLTLGFQKSVADVGYVGLGGRLGGIGSQIYLESGLHPIQGIGLDLQLGISPTGSGVPLQGLSWLGTGRAAFYWQF